MSARPEVFVTLPRVKADKVVGRLNQLVPTTRLNELPDGWKVKEPDVAMTGLAEPPQSASKKDSRMFAVLDVTVVPALKPRVGTF